MSAFTALAPLFRYPDETYADQLRVAQTFLSARSIIDFVQQISDLDLGTRQAIYTSTFDLAPSCSPYLGVHLFGDENRDRARLMVGLRMSYQRAGVLNEKELPDHIAEVFAFADRADGEEWRDLQTLVIKPALEKMDEILAPTSNPYRHLVSAALQVSGGES